jgi:very-short-patch-repair endonuclease
MKSESPEFTKRPFTRADAVQHGLDMRLLRGKRFRRIFNGVYIDRRVIETRRLRIEAGLKAAANDAWISHFSAGHIYGLPLPANPDVHLSVAPGRTRRRSPGLVVHESIGSETRYQDGMKISTPRWMFLELAEVLGLVDLVVVGDRMVRIGLVTERELAETAASYSGKSVRRARMAASLVRDRVDSPMETRTRMLIVLSGLPEPKVNRQVRDANGDVIAKFDLSYPELGVVVEYDGRLHGEDSRRKKDLERREWMDNQGLRLIVITASDIYQHPEETVARIVHVLRSRGMPLRRLHQGWRDHFPA